MSNAYEVKPNQVTAVQNTTDAIAQKQVDLNHDGKADITITIPPGHWLVTDVNNVSFTLSDAEFKARYRPTAD